MFIPFQTDQTIIECFQDERRRMADMGQNKKSNQGFVGRIWLSCSLEQKVRYIAGSAAIVVILSIAANLLVAGFGMKGFHTVLENNSHALSFWSAMSG